MDQPATARQDHGNGGSLALSGDGAANDVRVDVTGGEITVTGNNDTQISAGGQTFDAGVAV